MKDNPAIRRQVGFYSRNPVQTESLLGIIRRRGIVGNRGELGNSLELGNGVEIRNSPGIRNGPRIRNSLARGGQRIAQVGRDILLYFVNGRRGYVVVSRRLKYRLGILQETRGHGTGFTLEPA